MTINFGKMFYDQMVRVYNAEDQESAREIANNTLLAYEMSMIPKLHVTAGLPEVDALLNKYAVPSVVTKQELRVYNAK